MVDAVRNTQLAGVGQPVGETKLEKLADDNADVKKLKTALKGGEDGKPVKPVKDGEKPKTMDDVKQGLVKSIVTAMINESKKANDELKDILNS